MAGGHPVERLSEYIVQNHISSPGPYFDSLVRMVGPMFRDPVWPLGKLGDLLTGKAGLPQRHFSPHDPVPPLMSEAFEDYMFYAANQASDSTKRHGELKEVLSVKLAAVFELQPDVKEISPEDLASLSSEARSILPFRDKLLGNYDSLFKLTPHKKPDGGIEYMYWEQDRTHAIENLFMLTDAFPSPEHVLPQLERMKTRDAFPKDHHMNFDNWLRVSIEAHSNANPTITEVD